MQIVLLDHWSISTSHFVCVTTYRRTRGGRPAKNVNRVVLTPASAVHLLRSGHAALLFAGVV